MWAEHHKWASLRTGVCISEAPQSRERLVWSGFPGAGQQQNKGERPAWNTMGTVKQASDLRGEGRFATEGREGESSLGRRVRERLRGVKERGLQREGEQGPAGSEAAGVRPGELAAWE